MRFILRWVLSFCIILGLFGCEEESSVEPENNPPNKPSIIVQDSQLKSNESTDMYANVSDPDGDPISYLWNATGGSFNTTTTSSVTWTAPTVLSTQIFTITLFVQDNHGASNSGSTNITVEPNGNGDEDESQTIFIYSDKDVFVSSGFPDNNFDIVNQDYLGTLLFFLPKESNTNVGECRIYVYFDLNSIPENVTIDDANIILKVKRDDGSDTKIIAGVLMLNKSNFGSHSTSWSENTITWNSELNLAVTNLNNSGWLFSIDGNDTDLKASIKLDIQSYVDGSTNITTNYAGWVLRSFGTSEHDSTEAKVFWSSDSDSPLNVPRLKVTYH